MLDEFVPRLIGHSAARQIDSACQTRAGATTQVLSGVVCVFRFNINTSGHNTETWEPMLNKQVFLPFLWTVIKDLSNHMQDPIIQ